MPVKRVYIPKPGGGKRPLGIPTIKDRLVQMATRIVIEPMFEADFQENSYGFRPKRDAHQAMDDLSLQLRMGRGQVIEADISKYFDTIPHAKKSRGYKAYPYQYLYETLGLYKIPTTAPWTQAVKAVGRR